MTSWKGKSRGGVLGTRIFILILKRFNISLAYFVLYFVAFYYLIFTERSGIRYYFRTILGYPLIKTYWSIYRNYYKFGQVLLDKVAVLAGFSDKFTFNFDGENYLRTSVGENHGGVLIGAHLGNWEIAGQLLERLDTNINIVMFDAEERGIKELLNDVLVKKTVKIIFIKEDSFSYLHEISNALENKEIVAIHGDRFLKGHKYTECLFMGKNAKFPTGPFYLAMKYQVPVFFVNAMKETSTHYHFYSTEAKIYPYPSKLNERNLIVNKMIKDYTNELERILRKYPLQWFNYYNFWYQ